MVDDNHHKLPPQQKSTRQRWMNRLPSLFLLAVVPFLFFKKHVFNAPKEVNISNLRLVDLKGTPLPESLLQGKAVVLNYWAPWCGPCRIETPWLKKLQDAHPSDLLVIGLVADSDQYQQAAAFMEKKGVSYPLVRETPDTDSVFGSVTVLPTTFYITAQGQVVHAESGVIPEPLMEHYANAALAK
jgi:thiol-disulfide isomerase/thioredoxin